jgi:hypothetical protein
MTTTVSNQNTVISQSVKEHHPRPSELRIPSCEGCSGAGAGTGQTNTRTRTGVQCLFNGLGWRRLVGLPSSNAASELAIGVSRKSTASRSHDLTWYRAARLRAILHGEPSAWSTAVDLYTRHRFQRSEQTPKQGFRRQQRGPGSDRNLTAETPRRHWRFTAFDTRRRPTSDSGFELGAFERAAIHLVNSGKSGRSCRCRC